MIRQKITDLETQIRQSGRIDSKRKEELLELVREIRSELDELPEDKRVALQQAMDDESAAATDSPPRGDLTQEEAERDLHAMRLAANDFSSAVLRFETAHPRLTDLANRLALMLSSVGI